MNCSVKVESKDLLLVYWCSICAEFTYMAGVMAALSGPISSMLCAKLESTLSEKAPRTCEGDPRFSGFTWGISGMGVGNDGTMNVRVRMNPPSRVPSEAVADMKRSHVTRGRAACALSFLSLSERWPRKAITDAAMRSRPVSVSCGLGRVITVRMRTDIKVSLSLIPGFCLVLAFSDVYETRNPPPSHLETLYQYD